MSARSAYVSRRLSREPRRDRAPPSPHRPRISLEGPGFNPAKKNRRTASKDLSSTFNCQLLTLVPLNICYNGKQAMLSQHHNAHRSIAAGAPSSLRTALPQPRQSAGNKYSPHPLPTPPPLLAFFTICCFSTEISTFSNRNRPEFKNQTNHHKISTLHFSNRNKNATLPFFSFPFPQGPCTRFQTGTDALRVFQHTIPDSRYNYAFICAPPQSNSWMNPGTRQETAAAQPSSNTAALKRENA
jgi:hypothetical protein